MIDGGASETAAFADLNNDRRLDIVSSDAWYEAPALDAAHDPRHQLERPVPRQLHAICRSTSTATATPTSSSSATSRTTSCGSKNPGKAGGAWTVTEIDKGFPTEFAQLVDLDNDGKARELLPEFDRPAAPLAWFDLQNGAWVKHVVSDRSYGHGIGAGDINGDKRADILTPQGWFEAPADVRQGTWTFHATDWNQHPMAASGATPRPPPAQFGFMYALDVNGDGRQDVITAMAHDYGVLLAGAERRRQLDPARDRQHVVAGARAGARRSQRRRPARSRRRQALHGAQRQRPRRAGAARPLLVSSSAAVRAGVVWTRHIVDYGGRMGGGMQTEVRDMDGDGDLDIVSGGKAGLFVAENLTRTTARHAAGDSAAAAVVA